MTQQPNKKAKICIQQYEELKDEFELNNFKCGEQFYSFNHSLQVWKIFSLNGFKTRWMHKGCTTQETNKKGEIFDVVKRFVDVWVCDETMRQYESVRCLPPPLTCSSDVYNRWTGFALENHKSQVHSSVDNRILDHLLAVAGDDDKVYNYLLDWIASIIQFPGLKTKIMLIVMSAEKGTGKGIFGQLLQSLFGMEYCLHTSNPVRELFGNFNTALSDKLLVSIDELNQKTMDEICEDLKSLVSEPYQNINAKFQTLDESRPSFTNIVVFTNRFLKSEHADRRPVYLCMSNRLKGNTEHFNEMGRLIQDQHVMKMFYNMLKNRDLSNVHLERDRPVTELHKDMEQRSSNAELTFLIELGFTVNRVFYDHNHQVHHEFVYKAGDLYSSYAAYINDNKNYKPITSTAFGLKLMAMIKYEGMEGVERKRYNDSTRYIFNVPVFKEWLEKNNHMEKF